MYSTEQIAKLGYLYIIDRLNEQAHMSQNGGELRQFSGETVENFTTLIWSLLCKKYPHIKAQIVKGSTRPLEIFTGFEESVDKHCYINDILVCGIECKTYLDKCYMQRADGDFSLMKSIKPFESIIISLENGIGDPAFNFFMSRNNINHVFYCAEGKRNSAIDRRIYNNIDRIRYDYVLRIVQYFEHFFNQEIIYE